MGLVVRAPWDMLRGLHGTCCEGSMGHVVGLHETCCEGSMGHVVGLHGTFCEGFMGLVARAP